MDSSLPFILILNILDVFSVKEIVAILKLAIANTLVITDCMMKNSNDIFDFNTSQLNESDLEKLKDATENFRKVIDPNFKRDDLNQFQDNVHNRLRALHIATEMLGDIKNQWRPPKGKFFSGSYFAGDELVTDIKNLPQPVEPKDIAKLIKAHLEKSTEELNSISPTSVKHKAIKKFIDKLNGILNQFAKEALLSSSEVGNTKERKIK